MTRRLGIVLILAALTGCDFQSEHSKIDIYRKCKAAGMRPAETFYGIGCFVPKEADQTARIETASNADVVRVILKDGSSWVSHPGHGESKYAQADKLVAAVNGALSPTARVRKQ